MSKGRLEAFSDGVIAIIITIMVLELKVPHGAEGAELESLRPLIPVFLSYVISFVYIGIYWNNHHHLLQAARRVTGPVLWANLHLLFWLSLVPFVTAWMGENHFAAWPVAFYGMVMLSAGIAYFILAHILIAHHGKESTLALALGADFKGKLSMVMYAAAIPLAFVYSLIACGLYVTVAIIWLIPDRRIEKVLAETKE
ncbi:MAG TPA: TMEM175 family protein [Gemmataceae bacterium]|nr:TMEM175 family protein [Gemmataceae bacterium]